MYSFWGRFRGTGPESRVRYVDGSKDSAPSHEDPKASSAREAGRHHPERLVGERDYPVGYSEAIRQALQALPTRLKATPSIPTTFTVTARRSYPKAYAGGPLDEGGNRDNKLLEYFVTLELLDAQPGDVVSTSPASARSSPRSCAGQPARRFTART